MDEFSVQRSKTNSVGELARDEHQLHGRSGKVCSAVLIINPGGVALNTALKIQLTSRMLPLYLDPQTIVRIGAILLLHILVHTRTTGPIQWCTSYSNPETIL